uniref:OSIGBa0102N07.4 protein n=1 Tax=Oryza sativa TaxID=4530 RepID=Q01MS7_ORYSA|nr:OSIGBa0102N07.4 [Oryza sativa]
MDRLAIVGLMGRKGFLGPRGGELVKAKSSSFGRQSSPCTLRLRRLWPGATLRLAPLLLHSLRHGFRQVWSKGLMPSANKPLMGKGETGASAETVQTMWYAQRRALWAIFFATVNSKIVITPAGTKKTVFGSVNFNVRPERSDLWPVNATMSKWDRHWMARWFYHTIPFEAGSESAKALRCRCRAIVPNRRPKIAVDGAMEAQFILLWKRLGGRTGFTMANCFPGRIPKRPTTGPSRKRMRGQVKLAPKKRRVPASSYSDADDEDDAEERDDQEEGEEEEEVEAVADKAAGEAVEDRANTPGYTPTPSPGHNETRVGSNSSPLRRKDLEVAKALVAFSSGAAAKGGLVKKVAKKKELVDVARVFSNDESSDRTPTSPAGRSLDLSAAPIPPLGATGVDGSTAAGASASAERIVMAAAKVFGSPPHQPVASPLMEAKGKRAVAETSASEYSLSVPRFAPGDFETRADLLSFVEGVSNLVLPASALSLFTELNEFDEGCSAIKSLAVQDDELGRKNLEMEAIANTLKEAKAENKRLQSELEKGKEARAEVDRLKAELEKEKAHTAVLIDYYNLTEQKMEALRQEVRKAEASAAEESRRFSREMVKSTESAWTACQTLHLALTDMGVKVRGVPSEDASAFDFSEWTQQAGGSVSDCATAYGDCCARVSAAFTMGLLQQFGCEHIAEFPKYAKGDWEISAQDISTALRVW